LADWLNAIIYEMAARQMLFGRFTVKIDDRQLEGTLWGQPVDVARHAPPSAAARQRHPRLIGPAKYWNQ
jgi:SHS2 domain-containing protein